MNGDSHGSDADRVEVICDEFDRAWIAGEQPRLEDSLSEIAESGRPALFRELLKVECEHRCAQTTVPTRGEYEDRFSGYVEIVRDVFSRYVENMETRTFEPVGDGAFAEPRMPPELLDYEEVEVLGKGGMGVVYKARQRGTEQFVALKMVRADWIESMGPAELQQAIDQFYIEIKAAARLKYPNIVRVFHMGEVKGRPYFVMEHVDGESLADRISRDGPLSNSQAASYMAAVADAVHYAFQRGILHRDIKPQNILIDRTNDAPKIADFGLATLHSDSDQISRGPSADNGVRGGTIPYMAPELWRKDAGSTVFSEVYSLGATLYELLTGQPPFDGKSINNVGAERQPPRPVSELNPEVSRRLDRICMKCLDEDPEKRYGSAAELSTDLRNYLEAQKRAARMTNMSPWFFVLAFVILAINVGVYGLLQTSFGEPLVWLLVFAMYPPVFYLQVQIPVRPDRDNQQARIQLRTMWLGKMFAAVCIAIGLRVVLDDWHTAVLMSYPMFAGLTGMLGFVMAPQYWNGLYVIAVGFWILGVLMLLRPEWAPLEYGAFSATGIAVYGIHIRGVDRELG